MAGRILFVLIFVFFGLIGHIAQARQTTEYARSQAAPAATLMVPLSGLAILAGGLMMALGVYADLGALLLLSGVGGSPG